MLAKHAAKMTWQQFIDTKQDITTYPHEGIYHNTVTDLAKHLRANVGGVVSTRPLRRLNSWKAIPILQAANRDHLHHQGQYQCTLNIFIDGLQVSWYKPDDVVIVSLTLPTLKVPHQVGAVLRLCLWIGTEEPNELKWRVHNLNVKKVLGHAQKGEFDGHKHHITMNLDWGPHLRTNPWSRPSPAQVRGLGPHLCAHLWSRPSLAHKSVFRALPCAQIRGRGPHLCANPWSGPSLTRKSVVPAF